MRMVCADGVCGCAYPLREEELRIEVSGSVSFRIVVAQFGLQCQRRQPEEALFRGRLSHPQHILA